MARRANTAKPHRATVLNSSRYGISKHLSNVFLMVISSHMPNNKQLLILDYNNFQDLKEGYLPDHQVIPQY
jgi:hypothetical protein